jgi:hypothetical protein
MNTNMLLADLSERQLLQRFDDLVRRDRANTAQLLAHIAEIDARKLWAKHACPSMFAFCMERFHMSESVTAKRIWAARTARRFPVILSMVASGELHLSGINQLGKHLTEDNHRSLLARAKHKSSREIDVLVAELAPRPDVPSRVRALPRSARLVVPAEVVSPNAGDNLGRGPDEPSKPSVSSSTVDATMAAPDAAEFNSAAFRSDDARAAESPIDSAVFGARLSECAGETTKPDTRVTEPATGVSKPTPPHKQVVPLAPRRFKMEITIDQQTHDRLRALQDLLKHQFPTADPASIVSRALELLLEDTLKKKAAVTEKTRSNCTPSRKRARAIPAAIRREVWKRDVGRCAFVDERGRRCSATSCIEYHHEIPYGKGGQHQVDNIALRCRAHNQYQADLDFGREFMRRRRRTGEGVNHHENSGGLWKTHGGSGVV